MRTFTPFVAGIGRMPLARFQLFNDRRCGAWVALFLCGGFLFGNLPLVKNNFGLVTLLIIALSLLPLLWALFGRSRGAPEANPVADRTRGYAHRIDVHAPRRAAVARPDRAGAAGRMVRPGCARRCARRRRLFRARQSATWSAKRTSMCSSRARRLRLIYMPPRGSAAERCGDDR